MISVCQIKQSTFNTSVTKHVNHSQKFKNIFEWIIYKIESNMLIVDYVDA